MIRAPRESSLQTDEEEEVGFFPAKPLGVLRPAAAFPIPVVLTCVGEGPGRQQAAALRGRVRREMKLDSNAQDLALRGALVSNCGEWHTAVSINLLDSRAEITP